ncbi:hypothetical protein P0W64_11080 [Tsukamurella sp. 8F]|uniref:DUF6636 domain-containing protein n=1 Tax=unclassified Tsukamurella TaxID=2633480 RepID=UPI0023B9D7B9|nr:MULTISPECIES: DUF6636 domain-containing protein [unclassified Tsukamurella]MDF0529916.1 hypothetical protein [Tsukamurella sp. 8J]MDF0587312.1 hypothetical protein [Tsukamurella sp. 8F]
MRIRLIVAAGLAAGGVLVAGCGQQGSAAPGSTVTVTATQGAQAGGGTAGDGGTPATTETPTAGKRVLTPPRGAGLTAADPAEYHNGDGGDVAFISPTKNIWCRLGAGKYEAGCQAMKAPIPEGAGDRCKGNDMYPQSSLSRGFYLRGNTVEPACFNQGVFTSPNPKVLPYQSTIEANGYTCTSRETGITCTTSNGRGFVLSMQEARAF